MGIIGPGDEDGTGGGYGGGGTSGGGGVNWIIDPTPDTLVFNTAPANGAAIVVKEYDVSTANATSVWALGAWNGYYGYPGEVEFYAERLTFAANIDRPQTLWMSRIGDYSFFGKSTPILDDDAITATMNARRLNKINDLLPKQHLLALTTGGVWKVSGGDSEVVTPSTVSAKPQPSTGSSNLPALDVGETAVYLTQKGGQVRDLAFTFEADGYAGSDLTAFASHLLEGYTLLDWAYQDVPYTAVYAVRDDGWLLTMTYKREHQVVAWARHDTQGNFLSTVTVPEESEHGCYVIVERVVNGVTKKYIERFSGQVDDDRDWVGMDCALSYDGRNTTATTLTISGSGLVASATASTGIFSASDIGDAVIADYNGTPLTMTITAYVSATNVTGVPSRSMNPLVPILAGTDWAWARDTFSGLDHLKGLQVVASADGIDMGSYTVNAFGEITLSAPGAVVHVGLAFVSEFESLDMMLVGGQPVGTRQKLIREIGILLKDTPAVMAGTSFDHLESLAPSDSETGWAQLPVHGEWQQNPSVCIRNTSPFRCTVLAIEPSVEFGK